MFTIITPATNVSYPTKHCIFWSFTVNPYAALIQSCKIAIQYHCKCKAFFQNATRAGKELSYLLSDLQEPSLKPLDEESKIGKDYGQAVRNAVSTL